MQEVTFSRMYNIIISVSLTFWKIFSGHPRDFHVCGLRKWQQRFLSGGLVKLGGREGYY